MISLERLQELITMLVSNKVALLTVTKGRSSTEINQLLEVLNNLNIKPILGESYLQEFLNKKSKIKGDPEWHFIGNIQSKKIPQIVANFTTIHSIGNIKTYELICNEIIKQNLIRSIYLQINVSNDPDKGGFTAGQLSNLALPTSPLIVVLGLMTITKLYKNPEDTRADFRLLKTLANAFNDFKLSMGMSNDYQIAIEEGSSIIRLGSLLFENK
jgi:PLP dependent protein